MNEDLQDLVSKAMVQAYQIGQKYWQQADSESYAQNKKAGETEAQFYDLVDSLRDAIANSPTIEEKLREVEKETIAEVLHEALRFLDELPTDLGRGSLNGWKAQLRHKIGDMLTQNSNGSVRQHHETEKIADGDLLDLTSVLTEAGVFKGHNGLSGLLNACEFWEQQPYGTRLYYGDGITEYLHRDVLSAAVRVLEMNATLNS